MEAANVRSWRSIGMSLLFVARPAGGFVAPFTLRARSTVSIRTAPQALGTRIEFVGDVNDVIHGRVQPSCEHQLLAADAVRCAFIVGSTKGLDSMGEMLTVNGNAYCCSTEAGAGKHSLLTGGGIFTTGACILPLGARADRELRHASGDPPASWAAICRAALDALGPSVVGAVLCGFVTFAPLVSVQVAEPPIHGEFIFDRPDFYYARPALKLPRARVFVMGAVAPTDLLSNNAADTSAAINEAAVGMRRVLYAGGAGIAGAERSPREGGSAAVCSHAHGLVLSDEELSEEREVVPAVVRSVVHISADSMVESACLQLFAVSEVADHSGLEYVPRACC